MPMYKPLPESVTIAQSGIDGLGVFATEDKLKFDYKKWNLVTAKDIKKGDELTLRYTFYNV